MLRRHVATLGLVGALLAAPALAHAVATEGAAARPPAPQFRMAENDSPGCKQSSIAYHAALDEVVANLHSYNQCVNDSNGQNDCSAEFRGLQTAHDDFAGAVTDYRSDCN
jgi:hypothetical protein